MLVQTSVCSRMQKDHRFKSTLGYGIKPCIEQSNEKQNKNKLIWYKAVAICLPLESLSEVPHFMEMVIFGMVIRELFIPYVLLVSLDEDLWMLFIIFRALNSLFLWFFYSLLHEFPPSFVIMFSYRFSTWLLVFIKCSHILVTHFTPSDFINVRTHSSQCLLWSHVFCTLRFLFSCTINFIWFNNYLTSCLFLQQPSVLSRVCYSVSRYSFKIFSLSWYWFLVLLQYCLTAYMIILTSWPKMWSVLEKFLFVSEKNVYWAGFRWNGL